MASMVGGRIVEDRREAAGGEVVLAGRARGHALGVFAEPLKRGDHGGKEAEKKDGHFLDRFVGECVALVDDPARQ